MELERRLPLVTFLPRLDPDTALLRQFRATGNPRLFEALFKKYQGPIFSLVFRMVHGEEAYDLTQEVFYCALRSLPAFKGDCKFSTWLFTIARNVCLNHLREEKKRGSSEEWDEDAVVQTPDAAADVAKIAETRELQRVVDDVLTLLTPEQRMILILRDFEQMSHEEIGVVMDLTIPNVKSRLHRARLAFKEKFAPYLALIDREMDRGTEAKKR